MDTNLTRKMVMSSIQDSEGHHQQTSRQQVLVVSILVRQFITYYN